MSKRYWTAKDVTPIHGKVAIYGLFMCLDLDDLPPKLYYIGQAHVPTDRWHDHKHIDWHYNKFDRPCEARVLAWVDPEDANAAEKDLIRLAYRAGYNLHNTTHNTEFFNELDWRGERVLDYFRDPKRDLHFLESWSEKWVENPFEPRHQVRERRVHVIASYSASRH